MKTLVGYDNNQTLLKDEQGFTSSGGLQVMRFSEYPYYAELEIAVSGSQITAAPDPSEFAQVK
jgi:hypothetical protein